MSTSVTPISYKIVETKQELEQILSLQQINLPQHISVEESQEQGFVTIEHDFPLLAQMNEAAPQVIAVADKQVVGYALVMLQSFADQVPILIPMFQKLANMSFREKPFPDYNYYVMGQVCVDKAFRGRGIFDGMYHEQRRQLSSQYDFVITEVATRNTRSMRAHERVGFQIIEIYTAETGEEWAMILWDWS